jgi:hypothetical protein
MTSVPLVRDTAEMAYPFYAQIKGSRHWFFVVIGLDQFIHAATLAYTWRYVTGFHTWP